MADADYRKVNDGSHNSSTYHKKDGTNVRAKLKSELLKEKQGHLRRFEYPKGYDKLYGGVKPWDGK